MKVLLTLADAVLAGLFLAGFLALHVPPRSLWWLQLAGIALPYLAVLVVLAALGAGLMGRWASLGVYLVLCLLIALRFAGGRGAGAPEGEALVVMTFNADLDRVGRGEGRAVRALADREQVDVVALQEAPFMYLRSLRAIGVNPIVQSLLASGAYGTWMPDEEQIHLQLPVLSRLEWISQEERYLIGGNERTAYTRALLRWQGREVAVYNVHLRSFGEERPWREGWAERLNPRVWLEALASYRADFLARAEEAESLRQVLEAETRPFIVCGDFNSTSQQWVYGHLARGLTDAFGAAGRGIGFTYHARLPFVRIDHVLASSEWAAVSARVPRQPASDHLPVVAALVLREP